MLFTQDEILKMQMNQRCSINSHLPVEETSGDIVKMPSAATTKHRQEVIEPWFLEFQQVLSEDSDGYWQ
jgi:hypothetical protein